MAALSAQQIFDAWNNLLAKIINQNRACDLDIPALKNLVASVNTWIDNNAASFNSMLPVNVQTSWTPAEKAALLYFVALAKYG
jgi:hypothetical protein